MAQAIAGSGTGIWDRNIATGEIRYSQGWAELLGYRPDEVSNRIEDSYDRVHPDDLAYVQATMQAHFEGRSPGYEVEHRLRCKDGAYKWVLSRGRAIERDAAGRPLRMVGTTTDITSMRLLAEELRTSRDLIANLTNEIPGLVFQYRQAADGAACLSYASMRIADIFELLPRQVATTVAPLEARIHPEDLDLYRATRAASAADLAPWHCTFRVLLPVHGLRWRKIDAHPVRQKDGGILWHGLVVDVTEHKRVEQELKDLACIDHLTQLPNRRAFAERLDEAFQGVSRAATCQGDCYAAGGEGDDSRAAVLMIDIDHFKIINDTYGHTVGDAVIRHFATMLRTTLRVTDSAGRLGGEEFAACLPGADLAQAELFARRLRRRVAANPAIVRGRAIDFTVSIGISDITAWDTHAGDPLARADMALYSAKERGRNRVEIAAGRAPGLRHDRAAS
ncbi:sensor domain-containing diguanylate cyclase [Gluconacetobacter johannae]|uniref:Diguanylate cyclase n=1 Tax=Gluconacetobacter johannae TaxID=112140 RepID=A0A7W4P7R4_9PROT|nr:sensor domain-containing diguanylate cyclase [Gluconacetobacter johannae]MBB2177210.1 diguanylate cyclase [Gluconacetobacter johannae]